MAKNYKYDEDDYDYYDDDYPRDEDGYDEEEETVDYVKETREKLDSATSKLLKDHEIVAKLEACDYDITKTVKLIKSSTKTSIKSSSQFPSSTSPKKSVSAPHSLNKSGTTIASLPPNTTSKVNLPTSKEEPIPPASLISKFDHTVKLSSSTAAVDITDPSGLNLPLSEGNSPVTPTVASAVSQAASKPELSLVVVGHVDAGKSTLIGHLLYQLGHIPSSHSQSHQLQHQPNASDKNLASSAVKYAWLLDERASERAHGVTIDIHILQQITTASRIYTIIDTPGHRDFIPQMITGCQTADVALLLIPASLGEYEACMKPTAQTKEHALLLKALGVSQIIVVINKMDKVTQDGMVERYLTIVAEVSAYLVDTLQFTTKQLHFLPMSGLTGENLVNRVDSSSKDSLLNWYNQEASSSSSLASSSMSASTDRSQQVGLLPPASCYLSGKSLIELLDDITLPGGGGQQSQLQQPQAQRAFRAMATISFVALSSSSSGSGSGQQEAVFDLDLTILQGQLWLGDRLGIAFLPSSGQSGVSGSSSSSGSGQGGLLSKYVYKGHVRTIKKTILKQSQDVFSTAKATAAASAAATMKASNKQQQQQLEETSLHIALPRDRRLRVQLAIKLSPPTPISSSLQLLQDHVGSSSLLDTSCLLFNGKAPLPQRAQQFIASIFTMPMIQPTSSGGGSVGSPLTPIIPGTILEIYLKGIEMQCKVLSLLSLNHNSPSTAVEDGSGSVGSGDSVSSGSSNISKSKPKIIPPGKHGTITLQLLLSDSSIGGGLLLDSYQDCKALGRFALRSKGVTVAVGVIDKVSLN